MKISDRMIEAVEEMVQREADDEIARIKATLAEEGEDICVDCDDPIDPRRREALPSADRCIHCQTVYERKLRAQHD